MKNTTEATYLIDFAIGVKEANKALYSKLGEVIRQTSFECEDNYKLGREAMKVFHAFAIAANREINGDLN